MNDNIQIILGNPPSKSNCYRIVKFGNKASLAKTPALNAYRESFFMQCGKYRDKNITGFFEFHVKAYLTSMAQDLDNILKELLDSLAACGGIKNDNRCVKIVAEKYLDKVNPRVEFEVIEVNL